MTSTTTAAPSVIEQARELSDEALVERILAGEIALFELIMRRNNPRIYRAIRSLIRDEADVEDCMQAAYLAAFSKLRDFKRQSKFSTWLTQIAINEALGKLRRAGRHPTVSLTVVEEPAMSPLPDLPSPETNASRRELANLIERAVDALPDLYRATFMLREIEGMDTAETAEALGVSEDVVKTRLSRAKAALREQLEQLAGSAAPDAFGFHATRCDRVVANVMAKLSRG